MLADHDLTNPIDFLDKKASHINAKNNKKLALNSGIQNNQILSNDDEVCISRLSSILLAVNTFSWDFLH